MSEPGAGQQVLFIGLGAMGLPMATRLVNAGHRVHGYDAVPGARDRAAQRGVTTMRPAEATGVDVVVLVLPTSDVVESVVRGGLVDVLRPGTMIIDMSSSEPLRTRALAEELARRKIVIIDAPVSGGVRGAERGTLSVMVGGAPEMVQRVSPLLAAFGTPIHVGGTGAGHALKAINNLMSAAHLWATSEAVLVGREFGLEPATMLEVVNRSSGRSGSTQSKWPDFILTGGYDSGFALRLMLKDMRIATDLAHRLGLPVRLGDAAVAAWGAAADALPEDADHTEVARYLDQHEEPPAPATPAGSGPGDVPEG